MLTAVQEIVGRQRIISFKEGAAVSSITIPYDQSQEMHKMSRKVKRQSQVAKKIDWSEKK